MALTPVVANHKQTYEGGLIMADASINTSETFLKDIDIKIMKLSRYIDEMDMAIFALRHAYLELSYSMRNVSIKK